MGHHIVGGFVETVGKNVGLGDVGAAEVGVFVGSEVGAGVGDVVRHTELFFFLLNKRVTFGSGRFFSLS